MTEAEKKKKLEEIFGVPSSAPSSTTSKVLTPEEKQQKLQEIFGTSSSAPRPGYGSPPPPSFSPGSQYGDSKDAYGAAASFAFNNLIKPAASFVAGAPVTAYKALQATGKAGLSALTAIKNDPSLLWDKSKDNKQLTNLPYSVKDISAKASDPVNVPLLGNLNMVEKGANGQTDFGNTARTIAGKGAQTLATVGAFGAPSIAGAATVGALGAGGEKLADPNAGLGDILAATTVGGLTGAALQGVGGKLLSTKSNAIEKSIAKANLKPYVAEIIQKGTPEEKNLLKAMIYQAQQNSLSPDITSTPMEALADEVTGGMRKLHEIMKTKGTGIGETKGGIITGEIEAPALNIQSERKDFLSSLAKKKVFVDNSGNLNFDQSSFADLPSDQKALVTLWDSIKQKKDIPASEGLILRERLQNNLYSGKVKGDITAAEKYLTDFEHSLTSKIHANHPELGELDSVFAELKKATSGFQKKTRGSVPFTADQAIDGTNTFNLLRRSLGGGNKESKILLQKLEDLGNKYSIPELQNIMKTRRLAQVAEDAVGTDVNVRPTSFAGRAAQGLKGARAVTRLDIPGAIEAGKEIFSGDKQATKILEKLLHHQNNPNPLESLNLGKKTQQLLKFLTPSLGSSAGNLMSPAQENPLINQAVGTLSGLGGGILGGQINNNQ